MKPDELLALLTGQGSFDPVKIRGRLLARFGGEEGLADWLYDLSESPNTTPATKAKCADIILSILDPGKNTAVDYNTIDDKDLERAFHRIVNATSARAGLDKDPEAPT